jgi:cobalt-zinc-cadmium efflux system protein
MVKREGKLIERVEHGHDHDEGHAHGPTAHAAELGRMNKRRLSIVLVFGIVVLAVEVVGGLLSNSLVLLSDAAHIVLAYAAAHLSMRAPTSSKSYGYARAEIVAAFLNAVVLWGLTLYFFYEAWTRLSDPPAVDAPIVIVVGVLSLGANAFLAIMLHRGSGHNLNVRSAYIHILSDALGSAAAIVAGVGILFFDARWLDPATTFFIGALILVWTWRLTRETLHILLEGTPAALSPDDVKDAITTVPGVEGVHDLHVWSITTGSDNLSAHVVVEDPTQGPQVVRAIRSRLRDQYALSHITIEVEGRDSTCEGCN